MLRGDIERPRDPVPTAEAHFPKRSGQVSDMRRAGPFEADHRDQLTDVRRPRPHVGRQRVELPIHVGVQGLNAQVTDGIL